ncbi:S8 family serine peptidase, partial [Bacteroidota bacterium]
LNICPVKKKVTFVFDDGSHGTHCAGISAGYKIGNEALNGIAPGAYVIGLKLGNNEFSGGATVTESMKKAYLYADNISKERVEACIINMSFGIGSELEGRADIEKFLEELTEKNPYLYISTSNGNAGPGISTSGLPSATHAVFSSGAVLAEDVANDLYGAMPGRDLILHFSSRGGEVKKPDVISPGACVSTVPNFSKGDRFWGTSMASPYSAGVMALLLSGIKQEFPDVKIPSQLLYKVLRESADKIKGYEHVDQGSGMINTVKAYNLLKKYIEAGELKKFETYTVSSFSPNMPDNKSPSLYIRNGLSIKGTENYRFTIKRNNSINKDKFYRIYTIKSDSDWLISIPKKIHIRNNQNATVNIKLDPSKMCKPGLYNGKIYAYRADKSNVPEFEMMATVVIPYVFNNENNYSMSWENEKLAPGMHKRYYLNIPPGASSMRIVLSSTMGEFSNNRLYLHDPDGINKLYKYFDPQFGEEVFDRSFYDPEPGVYELVVLGQYTAKDTSEFNLKIQFDAIKNLTDNVICKEENYLEVVNLYDSIQKYNLNGSILGYVNEHKIKLDSVETHNIPFTIRKGESKKTFELEISKEDFNKLTDFAFLIYDKEGKALSSNGLGYRTGSISISNNFDEDEKNLTLTLIPGYANEAGQMDINIREITLLENTNKISVTSNNEKSVTLFPTFGKKLICEYNKPEVTIPKDSKLFGKINFISPNSNKTVYEIPVYIKF